MQSLSGYWKEYVSLDKIDNLRRRCCSDSREFEYWESLHNDIQKFMKNATDEERLKWFSDRAPGELAIMTYEYLKVEREQEK